jgi:hypothetical protein
VNLYHTPLFCKLLTMNMSKIKLGSGFFNKSSHGGCPYFHINVAQFSADSLFNGEVTSAHLII